MQRGAKRNQWQRARSQDCDLALYYSDNRVLDSNFCNIPRMWLWDSTQRNDLSLNISLSIVKPDTSQGMMSAFVCTQISSLWTHQDDSWGNEGRNNPPNWIKKWSMGGGWFFWCCVTNGRLLAAESSTCVLSNSFLRSGVCVLELVPLLRVSQSCKPGAGQGWGLIWGSLAFGSIQFIVDVALGSLAPSAPYQGVHSTAGQAAIHGQQGSICCHFKSLRLLLSPTLERLRRAPPAYVRPTNT